MAEFEFAGMNFKGGKAAIVFTALSTLGGALWAGFEFYADYMNMREVVQNIDVGVIESRNAVIETKLDEAIEYTRDIKNSLKDDITRIERVSDSAASRVKDLQSDVDDRLRAVSDLTRETEKDVRDTMRDLETRIESDMEKLETDLENKLQKALDNPLAD